MNAHDRLVEIIENRLPTNTYESLGDDWASELANEIINTWQADEVAELVNAAEQARKQLAKARTDLQQAQMTANTSNISQRDFSKLVGEF